VTEGLHYCVRVKNTSFGQATAPLHPVLMRSNQLSSIHRQRGADLAGDARLKRNYLGFSSNRGGRDIVCGAFR